MIYFCADDYGICSGVSKNIEKCIEKGALNKISIFPNFDEIDLNKTLANKNLRVSLHLNLVEGKCMAIAQEIPLIADSNGNFKYTFGGLFVLNLFHPKKLEEQVYKEITAQVVFWKSILPEGTPFLIDSHQHTHMIPAVFNALIKVIKDQKIDLKYMRIPDEPILPYIKTPSLYFTYSFINLIKQWLLKILWFINKGKIKNSSVSTALFLGILFSGKMDGKRVSKILPKYKKIAEKCGKDIEVLFHSGYLENNEGFENENIVFKEFYLSKNRKIEFDSVMNLTERSEL